MAPIAKDLSDRDIGDLAAYYSTQGSSSARESAATAATQAPSN